MLKIIGIFISIFLIIIIFLRIPQENLGLTSSTILNSPSSSQRFLNILTILCIFIYFGIALKLNFLGT